MGKEGLCNLGFDIPVDGEVTSQQAIMLNRVKEELPSASDVAKADNIELEEITRNAARSMEDLTAQFKTVSQETLPMHELLGLNKQLRRIRSVLKVEAVKKVQLEEHIMQERHKLEDI